jgi:hypothetical protein
MYLAYSSIVETTSHRAKVCNLTANGGFIETMSTDLDIVSINPLPADKFTNFCTMKEVVSTIEL